MRIQHNIMAMSSYRNYTNNVSAMKGNLEKLSSGYKINRAGDDAAGLAISEKMRAQITGLKQAQANAKSGINLVQTAEGALQEVQDMLNRMVKLAEQSANGTYDDDVDRNQLQKEFTRLTEEIDRINQSANFNGKALFGGPDAATTSLNDGIETYATGKTPTVAATTGTAAGEKQDATSETLTFAVSFTKDSAAATPTWAEDDTVVITTAGTSGEGGTVNNLNITATMGSDNSWTVSGQPSGYTGTFNGTTLTLTKTATGATSLTKDDYGAVTVTTTNTAESSLAGAGTLTVVAGKDEVPAKGTASKVDVDFNGLTGADVIGDTVTIGDKTYEFVKKGDTAASGNTKVEVGESDAAAALATAFETAVKGAKPTGTDDPVKADTKVTVSNSAVGTTALAGTVKDGGTTSKDKTELVASPKISVGTLDLGNKDTVLDATALTALASSDTFKSTGATAVKVNDDISVNLGGIGATWTASDNKKVSDLANAMLTAAKGAVTLWNTENAADKGYSYGNVRISTTAAGTGENDIIAQSAGDGLYILMDKITPQAENGGTTEFNFQVGDTNDTYNRIKISIKHIGSGDIVDDAGTALKDLSVADEDKAGAALKSLKGMVNYISDIRGDLGAAQNRLDHTINNLSVMEENIQDAESTIRDTDVADEMMAYTKNNILIQSAQAMLAQANQVPQGVLQLLQ